MQKGFTPKETVAEINEYPILGNPERKISKETCERYGVRAALSTEDGKTITAYYFPSYNQQNELVGYTKQDLTKEKKEKYHWSTIGDVSISNKLFGQNVAESIKRKKAVLTTTEGQWDALSTYQAICNDIKDTKWHMLEPTIVSIPLGTANAADAMLQNQNFVTSFPTLQLFFDADQATPAELKKGIKKGKEAREAVVSAFVGTVELKYIPEVNGFKDASDFLQDKSGVFKSLCEAEATLADLVLWKGKPVATEKIAHVEDIDFDEVVTPLPKGIRISSYPKLDEMLYTWRTGELTIVTSRSGAGKTTCMTKIAEDAIDQGERLGLIYLEEKIKQTLQRFVASKLKVSYKKFKRDPLSVASREDAKTAYDQLKNNKQLVFIDHFGSMPISELMAKVRHLHFVEGCKYILLDHLSMVISGSDVADERKEIDIVMTELAAFCAANDVAIMLVVHLNRQGSAIPPPPKGKENEPYWITVTKESMRGSGSLEQIAWNVLAIEQEIMPNRKRGKSRWVVLKNREGGDLGVADTFTLNDIDWSIVHFDDDAYAGNGVNPDLEEDEAKAKF